MQNQTPDLSDQDVHLLNNIILRAERHPEYPSHIRKALFDSYDAVFQENGLDTHHDRTCLRVLLQLGEKLLPGHSLQEKFQDLMRDAGIVLDYADQDDGVTGTDLGQEEDAAGRAWPQNKIVRRNSFTSIYDMTMGSRPPEKRRSLSPSGFPDRTIDRPDAIELEVVALDFDRRTLMKQALANWRQAGKVRKEEDMYLRAELAYDTKLKLTCLNYFIAGLHTRRELAEKARKAFLRFKYFNRWLQVHHRRMEQIADVVNGMRLKRNAFSIWNEELRVKAVKEQIDQRVYLEALYRWTIATREAELSRKVEASRKLRAISALFRGHHAQKDKIAVCEAQAEQINQKRLLRRALVDLSSKKKAHEGQAVEAANLHNTRMLHRSFDSIRSRLKDVQRQEHRADDARYYFLMTSTTSLWHRRAQEAKKKRLNEAYKITRRLVKTALLREVLKRWQKRTEQVRSVERQSQAIHERQCRAIVQNTFVKWQIGTSQSLQAEQQAMAHLDESLHRRYMDRMLSASRRLRTLEAIADRFHSVREDAVLSTQLRRVRMKGFEIRRREEDADAMRERHRGNRMRNMLRHWAEKARHPPSPLSTETTGVPPDSIAKPISVLRDTPSVFRDIPGGTPGYLNTPSRGRNARVRALALEAKTPMLNLQSRTPRPR